MKIIKIIASSLACALLMSVLAVNVYANTRVTSRKDATHNGTTGYAYSGGIAVNTTLYNGTLLAWTASVTNKPSSTTYSNAQSKCVLYQNSSSFSNLCNVTNVKVGNTTSSGTVSYMFGGSSKRYTHFNNMYKFYIKVTCPPAYRYTTTFNVGGVFYGT